MENSSEKKLWEGPYPEQQSPLSDKKMEKIAEGLKHAGYHFELTEDASEYFLRVEGFSGIMNITKVNDPANVNIEEILVNRITHPER
jgi:hypothetical protein